jgi:hypothetical protein
MPQTLSDAPPRIRGGVLSFFSLFTSLGTLLCCALPSLLVLCEFSATVRKSDAGVQRSRSSLVCSIRGP